MFLSKILFFLGLLINLHADTKREKVYFGHVFGDLFPENQHNVRLTYDFLIKKYGEKYNYDVVMNYDDSGFTNVKKFRSGKLDYLAMTYLTCAQWFPQLSGNIEDAYIITQGDSALTKYVILSNSTVNNKNMLLKKNAFVQIDDNNAKIFLDMYAIENHKKLGKDAFVVNKTSTAHEAILKIYFSDVSLAIVPIQTWETAKKMNPALIKKIKPMEISEPVFGFGIELFNNKSDKSKILVIKQANQNISTSDEGKQVFKLLKINKRERVTSEQLKKYLAYYNEYLLRLQKMGIKNP